MLDVYDDDDDDHNARFKKKRKKNNVTCFQPPNTKSHIVGNVDQTQFYTKQQTNVRTLYCKISVKNLLLWFTKKH